MPPFESHVLAQLVLQLIRDALVDGQSATSHVIGQYFFHTYDFASANQAPLTTNSALVSFHRVAVDVANAWMGGVLVYAFLRSMWERSFRARYTLRAILPKLLLVSVLVNFGLIFIQALIDLDNATATAFWGTMASVNVDSVWSRFLLLTDPGNIIIGFLYLLVGILLLVLTVTSVARSVVILLMAAASPLAAMCLVLPETRTYATSWARLFLVAVFSQALQVAVLRMALMLTFGNSFLGAIHGLVALYLVLRVPSVLHASSSMESKLMTYAKHAEHALHKGLEAGGSVAHHAGRTHAVLAD